MKTVTRRLAACSPEGAARLRRFARRSSLGGFAPHPSIQVRGREIADKPCLRIHVGRSRAALARSGERRSLVLKTTRTCGARFSTIYRLAKEGRVVRSVQSDWPTKRVVQRHRVTSWREVTVIRSEERSRSIKTTVNTGRRIVLQRVTVEPVAAVRATVGVMGVRRRSKGAECEHR
jgi:hypothetical protein